jgi:tetratricopeptide (TPR) repeat protein
MKRDGMPKAVHAKIVRLCKEADDLVESGQEPEAQAKYTEAWDIVPEPKENWEASTWILSSAGEMHHRNKRTEKALNCFLRAVQCPTGLGNPYVHLRIGQCLYEVGDMAGAGDNLTRAYMGAGEEIFAKEDPKYLEYLKTILMPPAPKRRRK